MAKGITSHCVTYGSMLISHRKKFVFVHIYKTAGTSITDLFLPYARLRDRLVFKFLPTRMAASLIIRIMGWYDDGHKQFTGVHKHAPAIEIKKYMGAKKFDRYYSFVFVRNPFDLMVSLYFYIRQNAAHKDHKRLQEMEFTDFVRWEIDSKPRLQYDFISDPESGEIIVDYIGYFERINEDLEFLKNKFGIRAAGEVKHKNPSSQRDKKDYRSYYTDEARELVASYFRKDLDELGYDFDGIKQKRIL